MAQAPLVPGFSFTSQAVAGDTFSVVSFEGSEGLSQLYDYTVELASAKKDLDLDALMASGATLTVKKGEGRWPVHGVLESFSELHEANGLYFYRAKLRPRLWRLTLAMSDRVFVNETVPDILQMTLKDGELPGNAFEFKLKESYPARDFVCRYGESLYDFFARWLSRLGMYYFFEQDQSGEKVVVTDTVLSHGDAPGADNLEYAQVSGLEATHLGGTVHDFGVRRELTPAKVALKDYNYRKPDLDLTVEHGLDIKGAGEAYLYGEHYRTPQEGKKLAKIRAEELAASSLRYSGMSTAPGFRSGTVFKLHRHFAGALNTRYLIVTVAHKGYAAMAGTAGLGPETAGEARNRYENRFTAIPAQTQFRPPLVERAAIAGVMDAVVDAAGSGQYAELDEEGRYKITLPFDQSGLSGGKASAAVRMLQPYGGAGFGMHCPLHKGAEAALGYADGNPDRPIIIGAAPNPENKSPVTTDNQTQCRLTTGGGNKLHFEDQEGNQRILMQSKTGDFMRIGSHNDPINWDDVLGGLEEYFSEKGIALYAPGNHWLEVTAQNEFVMVIGETMLLVLGWYTEIVVLDIYVGVGLSVELDLALKIEAESLHEAFEGIKMRMHPEHNTLQGTNQAVTMADIKASMNTTATALSSSRASIEQVEVNEEANKLAGQKSTATQVVFDASQDANQLSGERMNACQDALHTSQTRQQLAGQRQLLAQENIRTTVERTQLLTAKTSTDGDRMLLASNKVEMAANELAFFGIYSKE